MFTCEFSKISKNTFFYRKNLWAFASVNELLFFKYSSRLLVDTIFWKSSIKNVCLGPNYASSFSGFLS